MPIRTTTVDRHRTFVGLAKTLFETGNRPEATERAVEALRRANPQLAEDTALKSGMTFFVPRVEGLNVDGARVETGDEALVESALERTKSFAQQAGKLMDDAVAAARQRAKDTHAPKIVNAIMHARPEVDREMIGAMQEGAAREPKRIEAAAETLRVTIDAIVKDLKNRPVRRGDR